MLQFNRDLVRPRLRSLLGVQVLATGSYAPEVVVSNEELETALGYEPGWILKRTGIRQRRHAPPHMATSDMAVEAARRAIMKAEVDPADIDLVIVGTFTPDMPLPSTACQVQHALRLNAPAMDVQAACAGFLYALVTGMQFVASGCSELALVVGADCNSRIMNPRDQRTYPLFGDAAGAVLLARGSPQQGLVSYTLGADGSGAELLSRPMGGSRLPPSLDSMERNLHYMHMDGRAVFKWAIGVLSETISDVLGAAGMTLDDVDLLVAHQANIRIIEAAANHLGIDRRKVFTNLDRYGNTSAASVPLALDEACTEGRIKRGHQLVLSGFGAGLVWGTALLRW
jgi:3-oxoacyl-[acyl-carrier-protein] synthase-3